LSLPPGSRIGVYEILSALGAGGMGEVYRARDTKLGRDVALKIVPDILASEPEYLARFEREARTLASLNHPHIAHLHGFEDSGPTRALVMELVEGEDLARRIARGPIPLDEALAIAKQIAEALEAAHEQGIIHRDLKPANIKVRDDGTVKVLDFGLAKVFAPAEAGALTGVEGPGFSPANSPTITTPAMTVRGVILGTAAYMAPEQAKGKAVDKRADIWAFGCVLYEMVTGRRAFAGDDVSDTLASVLRAGIDWNGVPPTLGRLLKKCLERDPRQRLHDIGDAWDLIDAAPVAAPPVQGRRGWLAWSLAGLLAATAIGLAVAHFGETAPAREVVRFQIQPPPAHTFDIYLALSPDGRRLAFTARDDNGVIHLWVRELDTLQARVLPGTEGAWSPFWSPDSRYLAFADVRLLKKIDVLGGPPQTLCESPAVVGSGTWNRDGVIVFGTRGAGATAFLRRVAATGGDPTPLTALDQPQGESFHAFPSFLPDGRHFLYFRQSSSLERQGFYVGSLDVAPAQQPLNRLVPATLGPAQVVRSSAGTARLLFLREATLTAQTFDPERLQLVGDATPIAERVGSAGSFGFFSASANDVLVYRTGLATFTNFDQLTWLDRTGRPIGTIGEGRAYSAVAGSIALAPDASRAVVGVSPTPTADLWVVEFTRGTSSRFTFHEAADTHPVWSPDGRRIVFRSARQGPGDLYVKDANGINEEIRLVQTLEFEAPTSWSPDGRFVLFSRPGPKSAMDVWLLPLDGDRSPSPLLATPFAEGSARISPDGRWIAYQSNESGRNEIYLRRFVRTAGGNPSVGAKWLVSTDGGADARWRRDGRELFYRHPSGAVMAADVSVQGEAVQTSIPRRLFALAPTVVNWDVVPNGQRFLVLVPVVPPTSDPVSVVLNWSQALRP
jgi:Tol biopolymer transport system component